MNTARIFEIKKFAVHDGPGIRTTVFFKGCPLRCVWCHNPEGLSASAQLGLYTAQCVNCGACVSACPTGAHILDAQGHRFDRERCTACGTCERVCLQGALRHYGKEMSVEQLLPVLLADREFYVHSGGGVTLSGGECLVQADFCAALLEALQREGIHTAVDTCGAVPSEALEAVLPHTDLFLFDLKAIDEAVHLACTDAPNAQILENLRFLDKMEARVEIRVPLVPGYNDAEMPKIAAFLTQLQHTYPVTVLAYHALAGSKYEALGYASTLPPRTPTEEELAAARACFQK